MYYFDTKHNKKLLINIVTISFAMCCIGVNVFAATGPGATMATQETTKGNWGVKIENAEYYDYVEYDDQGRLVDKNRIIIGKGEGGLGQGGGSSGQGGNGADSSGTSGKGTSGGLGAVPGQGGGGDYIGGSPGNNGGKNIIGNSGNQSSNIALRKQQAAEEASRQASIEAEIATAGMRQHEIQESIQKRLIKESLEKESSKQESMKASANASKRASQQQETNRMAVTVNPERRLFDETTTIIFKEDDVTMAPETVETKPPLENERVTQPKVTQSVDGITPDQVMESVTQTKSFNNIGPTVEQTTVIESETVMTQEVVPETTQKVTTKETDGAKNKNVDNTELKKGDKGEKDHDDEDASFKLEGGENVKDGKGGGQGEKLSGVKIFEIERKGNIGREEEKGINNIEGLIVGSAISLLLLIGILYYYIPYMFKSKKRKKSDYIM